MLIIAIAPALIALCIGLMITYFRLPKILSAAQKINETRNQGRFALIQEGGGAQTKNTFIRLMDGKTQVIKGGWDIHVLANDLFYLFPESIPDNDNRFVRLSDKGIQVFFFPERQGSVIDVSENASHTHLSINTTTMHCLAYIPEPPNQKLECFPLETALKNDESIVSVQLNPEEDQFAIITVKQKKDNATAPSFYRYELWRGLFTPIQDPLPFARTATANHVLPKKHFFSKWFYGLVSFPAKTDERQYFQLSTPSLFYPLQNDLYLMLTWKQKMLHWSLLYSRTGRVGPLTPIQNPYQVFSLHQGMRITSPVTRDR
ncbi:hypothetical protein FJZ48_01285 [Candidatus Uhrbacteria bacterium]|nr:hypothetical protein [Candidatus Uhrbacteria bacterium]